MKDILNSNYKNYFLGGLILILISAFFGVGSHHPDEYFQIFEFANYQLGNISEDQLPWEFTEKMRPTFQPQLTAVFIKFCYLIGISNPFTIALILRVLIGFIVWTVTSQIVLKFLEKESKSELKLFLVLITSFLWFTPYLYSRFSSEILSMALLLRVVYLIEYTDKKPWHLIGFYLAISFFTRFQLAFAIIGVIIYVLIRIKPHITNVIWAMFGFLVGIALMVELDTQFYGEFVFTPWEYFRANILEQKAAGFGTSPFYQYIIDGFLYLTPTLSIIVLPLLCIGIWKNKTSIWSLMFIFFFLGHSIVGHKEIRFLFPMIFTIIVLTYLGVQEVFEKKWFQNRRKVFINVFKVVFALNLIILPIRTILPAQEAFVYFQKMSKIAEPRPSIFIGYQRAPFRYAHLPVNFYKNENVIEITASNEIDLKNKLDSLRPLETPVFVLSYNPEDKLRDWKNLQEYYSILPSWIYYFNFNNWISRSRIWKIYSYDKIQTDINRPLTTDPPK
jgi:phosphatidylinositol glycan class B